MELEERIRQSFEPLLGLDDRTRIEKRGKRRKRGRHAAVVLPVIAAITVGALVLPGLIRGQAPSAAAATFRRLSAVAARQPQVELEPGQYLYSRIEALWGYCTGDVCVPQLNVRDIWYASDGSGRIVAYIEGEKAFVQDESPGSGLMYPDVPQDVEGLRAFIEAKAAGDPNVEHRMFVVVGDLLRQTFWRSDLYDDTGFRAALFEVASTLPGVELIGEVEDESGRPGIAVGHTYNGSRDDLIFDMRTSALLGERELRIEDGWVTSWAVYETFGPVEAIGDRPSGVDPSP